MALTKFGGATNTIQLLSDQPNQSDGLTAAQLKLKFDQHAIDTETYLNDTLTVELDANFATKAEVVKTTTDQTIAGVKTFLSSPIVPTPTTSGQASPKGYVDSTVAGVVLGQIPDGTITPAKLSFDPATQVELDAHVADKVNHVPYGGTTTNTGNAYVLAYAGITALSEGVAVCFKCNADSSGASTINVNGLGAKSIKKANGTDVTNLKNGGMYTVRYDGANFILQGEGASGNATASDLALGKTATTDAGEITGTGENAKRYATGSLTSAPATMTFYDYNNVARTTGSLTVSGLTFEPSTIVAINGAGDETVYQAVTNVLGNGKIYNVNSAAAHYFKLDGTAAYVTATGFRLPVATNSSSYTWYAYE